MIVYNGVSIDSVAPVMIEDIRVAPIRYNPVSRPRAIRFGSEWVRMGGGDRIITISLAVLVKSISERHEAFMALSKWAKTDSEYVLELPQDPLRFLQCVCTNKPEPSTRAWWENKLKLTFTCVSNPYWTSKQEKSVACGTAFYALGDAPPLMQIRDTLRYWTGSKSYTDGTNTMTFSDIPPGNLVIDVNRQTAVCGSTNIMQYYQPAGSFIIPKHGSNIITETTTFTGKVYYRERWE